MPSRRSAARRRDIPRISKAKAIPLLVFAFTLATANALYAQKPEELHSEEPNRQILHDPESSTAQCDSFRVSHTAACVSPVIDAARNSLPEFHSLALLLLIEADFPISDTDKLKLAQEALDTAASVVAPMKMQSGVAVVKTDSDVGANLRAYEAGLDRVSLQARALDDINKLNPKLAHQLFTSLKLPELQTIPCSDALAYDPKAYFDLLWELAHKEGERTDDRQSRAVDLIASSLVLQTHTELPSALALVSHVSLSNSQLQELTQSLIGQISRLQGDRRGFETEMSHNSIRGAEMFYQILESHERNSGATFLSAYRQYLVENYQAGGCGTLWVKTIVGTSSQGLSISFQDLHSSSDTGKGSLPDPIQSFNSAFAAPLRRIGAKPISFAEINSNVPVITAAIRDYWSDPASSSLLKEEQRLRSNPTGEPRTEAELASSSFQSQAISFLEKIEQWSADPFASEQIFEEKMELYMGVLGLFPAEAVRQDALEKIMALLEGSAVGHDNPALWFTEVGRLRSAIAKDPTGNHAHGSESDFQMFLLNSANSDLHLIGLLEAAGLDPFLTTKGNRQTQ